MNLFTAQTPYYCDMYGYNKLSSIPKWNENNMLAYMRTFIIPLLGIWHDRIGWEDNLDHMNYRYKQTAFQTQWTVFDVLNTYLTWKFWTLTFL